MERLAGRYELGDALGQGRSTVFRAVDTRLRRTVAIKRIALLAGQEDEHAVRIRALREAQAAARLNNPSVVTVYDVVEEPGAVWLVMELVDGPSLASLVAADGPLPHRRAAALGLSVLTALEAAHLVGIVHRDVKPANVLVPPSGPPKLTDFGVATIRDESRVTATGLIVGSPSYMAPEQATGAPISPATDLWSLGALLYFAVEGEPPFLAGNALATAAAVVHAEPRAAERPGPLSPLLASLLVKNPEGRATAGQVRAALSRIARGDGRQARDARRGPPRPTPEVAGTVPAAAVASAPGPGADPTPTPPAPTAADEPTALQAPVPAPPAAELRSDAGEGVVPAPVAGDGPGEAPPAVADDDGPGPAERSAPPARPVPPAAPRPRWKVIGAAAAVLVALAVAVPSLARAGGDGGWGDTGDDEAGGTSGPTTVVPDEAAPDGGATADDPTTTSAPATTTAPPGPSGIPAGWTPYTDPAGTYTIGVPPGWRVQPRAAYRIDLVDPSSGAFLRVEYTDTPGADPAQAWRDLEPGFASGNANYQQIGIAPATYRGYDAALWEFRHGSGETLHTGNLGFLANGRGYALMLRTPEGLWAGSQPLFDQFKQSFQPL
jgi:eukaryotic-like serine/threonine-protein kinase